MGINYNSSVITDSLALSLDFANPKNYSYNVHPYPKDITKWITVNSGSVVNCTISSDSTQVSPVGGISMKMVTSSSDARTSTYNQLKWNLASANVGDTWTASVWVKANTATTIQGPFIFGSNSGGIWPSPGADAETGSFDIDTNWKRISVPISMSSANTQAIQVRLDGPDTFTSPVAIWWDGIQVEKSISATEFNPKTNTSGNTVTEILSASDFLFHGDEYSSHTPLNALVEPERTNFIRNNTMVGAVAGTPGTLPTNWGYQEIGSELAYAVVGTGTENGITYIDIRVSGTVTAQRSALIFFESTTGVGASAAQSWTESLYLKVQAGSTANIEQINIRTDYYSSVPAFLSTTVGSALTVTSAALNTQRQSSSVTTPASTAFIQPNLRVRSNATGAIDITLRIGLPQLEIGADVTSVIKTKTEARTRYPQKEGTITFDRTLSSSQKFGGGASRTMTGNLTASNFLYNNHTWDIWFRINDRTPGLYGEPSIEGYSTLLLYKGYHGGFFYDATTLYYTIWYGISTSNTVCSWTVGTSGAQINQGSWYNLSVTKSGDVFTPYINGNQLGTGGTFVTSNVGIGTSNDLHFGKSQNLSSNTGNFLYYSKNTIGAVKMYTKALTASEIEQNFNALRGRYGV